MISGARVLLTGGAGFIGTTLCRALAAENELLIYDDLRRNALESSGLLASHQIKVERGDVLDATHLQEVTKSFQPDLFIHLAAIAGIDTVIKKPSETMRVNMLGTANALEAASTSQSLTRFIDLSTSEVFGSAAFRAEEGHDTHIGAVGEARWTYAVSKLAGEHLTKAYHSEFGLPTVTLRPFNVYGPGQVGEGAIRTFIQRAITGEDLLIHGDGNQIRAWCYVDDFIDAVLLAAEHPDAIGESFNIGNARAVITILGLAQTIVRVTQSASSIKFVNKDYADIELRVPSVRKAQERLGFSAKVDLDEGVDRTAQFYRGNSRVSS